MNEPTDIEINIEESAADVLRAAKIESAALKVRVSQPGTVAEKAATAVELCDLLDWCTVMAAICHPSYDGGER